MDNILKKYDLNQITLQEFQAKAELLLMELLRAKSINFHQITSRLKTKESLSKKIINKQGYSCLEDVTDIVGCRVITYFEDEVDRVAEIIEKEFEIDLENSVDKRKIEYDRFGYLSLHYVVKFNANRLNLTEYKRFKDYKFEIQIRSILQHSWAEIEHDIGYKGKFSIPDIVKRRFSRIAALLETADIEFVRLRKDLTNYEHNIKKEIASDPANVDINKASLISFINTNKDLQKADKAVSEFLNINLTFLNIRMEHVIALMQFANILNIHDLNELYKNNLNCIIEYSKHWRIAKHLSSEKKGGGIKGISIYDAAYYVIAKTKSKDELFSFIKKSEKNTERDTQKVVDRCFAAYEKMNKNCH
jgi:putative GTP pyrophosphokinase